MTSSAASIRTVPTISSEGARALVTAVVAAAGAYTASFSVTVVDPSGVPIAMLRGDGAPLQSVQISGDKAYTAAGFKFPTVDWVARTAEPGRAALMATAINRLTPFGGGVPIVVDGAVIGAIGVSGGTAAEDAEIATAAIEAVFGS